MKSSGMMPRVKFGKSLLGLKGLKYLFLEMTLNIIFDHFLLQLYRVHLLIKVNLVSDCFLSSFLKTFKKVIKTILFMSHREVVLSHSARVLGIVIILL